MLACFPGFLCVSNGGCDNFSYQNHRIVDNNHALMLSVDDLFQIPGTLEKFTNRSNGDHPVMGE